MTLGVHLQRLCGPTDKLALIEVLLLGQSLADGEVNPGKALQVVVVEIPVGCVQPVNPSGRLRGNLVGILLRVEYNGVRGNAVPTLTAGGVLDEVHPLFSGRDFLVLVTVPLRNLRTLRIPE